VPVSVLTSRADVGLAARRIGLFQTPAETRVPREIAAAENYAGMGRPLPRFTDAVVDPDLHALVRLAARRRSPLASAARDERVQRALAHGPHALSPAERLAVLGDLDALDALHMAVRLARVHPDWTSSHRDARATIHHLTVCAPKRPGTVATLVGHG
jgi:membrane glycosyltransferase